MSDFNRDGTVAVIRDYYHFLTKMYLDESRIMEPPPGSWPNITPETMRCLGKADAVIDLLRHLPYVKNSDCDEAQIGPYAQCAVWTDIANRLIKRPDNGILVCTDGCDSDSVDRHGGPVPPYCIGLTFAGEDDTILLLDTEWSCVWWVDCPDEIESAKHWRITQEERDGANVPVVVEDDGVCDGLEVLQLSDNEGNESRTSSEESPPTSDDEDQGGFEDEFIQDDEDNANEEEETVEGSAAEDEDDTDTDEDDDDDGRPEWMQDSWYPEWSIPEFFSKMKRHFHQLHFVPKDSKKVLEGWPRDIKDNKEPRLADLLKPIYRKHGWPDLEEYRKEECLKEIRKAVRKHDPGAFDSESDSE